MKQIVYLSMKLICDYDEALENTTSLKKYSVTALFYQGKIIKKSYK